MYLVQIFKCATKSINQQTTAMQSGSVEQRSLSSHRDQVTTK